MKKEIEWVEKEHLLDAGISHIGEADVVLDIGCGIVPHNYISPFIYFCCEPFSEYVEVLEKKLEKNTNAIYIVLNYDWEKVINEFAEGSVDTVYLIDVIEHLDKEEGERLLRLTERIARKQIIIFTPLGFIEQKILHGDKDAWGLNGASWQVHKSGWLPKDFDDSWDIIACRDFHKNNNIGEELAEPFGAFWAIKNINNTQVERWKVVYNEQISREFYDKCRNICSIFNEKEINYKQQIAELKKLEPIVSNLKQEKAILLNRYRYFERFRLSRFGRVISNLIHKIK